MINNFRIIIKYVTILYINDINLNLSTENKKAADSNACM